jgi:hypothetical protein
MKIRGPIFYNKNSEKKKGIAPYIRENAVTEKENNEILQSG